MNALRRLIDICRDGVFVGAISDMSMSNSSSLIANSRSQVTSRRTLLSQLHVLLGAELLNKWLPYFLTTLCFRSSDQAVGNGPKRSMSNGRWMRSASARMGS